MSKFQVVEEPRTVQAATPAWSPAQIVALIAGIGVGVLGIAAVARTGFDTSHIYTPKYVVWHMQHSPLFALIEITFGVLLVLSGVVPGGFRGLMTALGAAALAFGIVVLSEAAPNRLNQWLGATHRTGWFYVAVGAVVVLAALLSPVFFRSSTSVVTEQRVVD